MSYEMKVQLNGKEFVLDEEEMMDLLFLMDEERLKWFRESLGEKVFSVIDELKEIEQKMVAEGEV